GQCRTRTLHCSLTCSGASPMPTNQTQMAWLRFHRFRLVLKGGTTSQDLIHSSLSRKPRSGDMRLRTMGTKSHINAATPKMVFRNAGAANARSNPYPGIHNPAAFSRGKGKDRIQIQFANFVHFLHQS